MNSFYVHKTNPDLSYFELSYVFWEHNDSVGQETTVQDLGYVEVSTKKSSIHTSFILTEKLLEFNFAQI